MVGYIGANGAGKSTTIKIADGHPDADLGPGLCNGFVPHRERTRYVATIGRRVRTAHAALVDIAVVESFRS